MRKYLATLLALVAFVHPAWASVTVSASVTMSFPADSITVNGTLEAKSYVSADQASKESDGAVATLKDALGKLSLKDTDIALSGATTSSRSETVSTDGPNGMVSSTAIQAAHLVTRTITVKLTDPKKKADVVAALKLAGFSSVTTTDAIADEAAALKKAIQAAMQAAHDKADAIASSPAAPSTLGGVVNVVETNPGAWHNLSVTYAVTVTFASTPVAK